MMWIFAVQRASGASEGRAASFEAAADDGRTPRTAAITEGYGAQEVELLPGVPFAVAQGRDERLFGRAAPASAAVDSSSCCVTTVPAPAALANCGGDRWVGAPFATRSPVLARNGAAASSQPLVTSTAIDVLRRGGNAVDAAVAANAVQAVVEPMSNGPGGDLMVLAWDASTRRLYGYNGSGRSSKSLSYDGMAALLGGSRYIPDAGPLSVSVPGAVEGWCRVQERLGSGTLSLAELLQPAIGYATDGFAVTEVIAAQWEEALQGFRLLNATGVLSSNGKYPRALDGLLETYTIDHTVDGRAPRAGEVFRNPALAATLTSIAEGGCDAFYNGTIAQQLVQWANSTAGVHLTTDDFASHTGAWVEPVNATYRGNVTVFELPPNPQGLAALEALNIMETFDVQSMGLGSADALHVAIEAKKLAFADRASYYADPNFADVPVEGLASKAYAAKRAKLINMTHAAKVVNAGDPGDAGDTIYLTVADAHGNMVSWIQSNYNDFGSGLAPPSLGFALQSRGSLFAMHPRNHSNAYRAGKRPFHTIMPGFATLNGEPWLSFGVMGGGMQPQGHAQIISNLVDFGLNVQEAGDSARWRHFGSSQPTGSIMTNGGSVALEGGICAAARADLAARGHKLEYQAGSFGGYQAILRDPASGVMHAASDMRKDGHAAGF